MVGPREPKCNAMTNEEWHARINEISDICNTTIIYDYMTREQIVDLFEETLAKIYKLADYPPETK